MALLRISIIINGINDLSNICGIKKTGTSEITPSQNTILNHVIPGLLRMMLVKQRIIKGFSQTILRFHFVCSWSVMKLKKIIHKARSEKKRKIAVSRALIDFSLFNDADNQMIRMKINIRTRRGSV